MGGWRNLVLYDGACGLCDRVVRFLLRHDRRGVLVYAPLLGETARPFVGEGPAPDTLLFVQRLADGSVRVSRRSRAVFAVAAQLGWPWRALSWWGVLPVACTDPVYRIVARHRLRLFGPAPGCSVPGPATRGRLLA